MAVAPDAMTTDPKAIDAGLERQRRIRRNVWWLSALALSFYLGFIVMSVRAAHG